MGGETVELRPARVEDLDTVLSVLDEAAGWLSSRGVEQWPDHFDPAWLGRQVARGDTWLAVAGGRALGTLEIAGHDPAWGGPPRRALHVHRLAVRRRAKGLGRLLLGWAAARAERQGCAWLRLDCVMGNGPLRRYYERLGFEHAGDTEVHGPPGDRAATGPPVWISLYQLPLGPGADPGPGRVTGR